MSFFTRSLEKLFFCSSKLFLFVHFDDVAVYYWLGQRIRIPLNQIVFLFLCTNTDKKYSFTVHLFEKGAHKVY